MVTCAASIPHVLSRLVHPPHGSPGVDSGAVACSYFQGATTSPRQTPSRHGLRTALLRCIGIRVPPERECSARCNHPRFETKPASLRTVTTHPYQSRTHFLYAVNSFPTHRVSPASRRGRRTSFHIPPTDLRVPCASMTYRRIGTPLGPSSTTISLYEKPASSRPDYLYFVKTTSSSNMFIGAKLRYSRKQDAHDRQTLRNTSCYYEKKESLGQDILASSNAFSATVDPIADSARYDSNLTPEDKSSFAIFSRLTTASGLVL